MVLRRTREDKRRGVALGVEAEGLVASDPLKNLQGVSRESRFRVIKMVANGGAPPRGSAAAAANMRRRRTASAGSGGVNTMLQFYTDDNTGAKIAPNTVLIMSIGFIAFVAILHVLGKFYFVPRAQ